MALLALTLSAPAFTGADELQKTWEVGLGLGGITTPDYRGSKEQRSYLAPIPYVIYRGKYLQSDRSGLRSRFLERDKLELNISLSASITPDSDKNTLRAGMPRLGSTVEIGPALNISLSGDHLAEGLTLHIPARAVIAVGQGSPDYIGSLIHPQLLYHHTLADWRLTYSSGLIFATNAYHEYYYSVDPAFVTPDRPGYQASGGYSGWSNQLSLGRRDKHFLYALFIRHTDLHHTGFLDSPLVETRQAISGGFAIFRVLR